jgi:hypothetical protein
MTEKNCQNGIIVSLEVRTVFTALVKCTMIQEGMAPCGDSVEELISCLKLMLNATNKPVFQPPKESIDDRNRD